MADMERVRFKQRRVHSGGDLRARRHHQEKVTTSLVESVVEQRSTLALLYLGTLVDDVSWAIAMNFPPSRLSGAVGRTYS